MTECRILVIDGEGSYLKTIKRYMEEAGESYEFLQAHSGQRALDIALNETVDLIITDWEMPEMGGIDLVQRLKESPRYRDLPIIMCTGIVSNNEHLEMALSAGAVDYIRKPIEPHELIARVRSMLQLGASFKKIKEQNEQLQAEITERKKALDRLQLSEKKLRESYHQLELLARTDPLTRLPNRRDFMERTEKEIARFKRNAIPFVLAIADVDLFKTFNDRYGHDCGDYVLTAIAALFRALVREQDHVGRWGGEEFIFLFPNTELEGGRVIAEKLRERIAETDFTYQEQALSVTITIGICAFEQDMNLTRCLKQADYALYKGKERGRNCVVVG